MNVIVYTLDTAAGEQLGAQLRNTCLVRKGFGDARAEGSPDKVVVLVVDSESLTAAEEALQTAVVAKFAEAVTLSATADDYAAVAAEVISPAAP